MPWRGRDIVFAVLTTFGGLIVASVFVAVWAEASDLDFSGTPVIVALELLAYGIFSAALWLFIGVRRRATMRAVGFRPVKVSTILLMVPAVILVIIVSGIIAQLIRSFLDEVPTAEDQLAIEEAISGAELAWLFLATVVVAPIVEETFFRGILYRYLKVVRGVAFATFGSGILFALIHLIPELIPVFLFLGVAFAFVAERYDSLYPAIALHALNNGVALLGVYLLSLD